MMWRLARLFAAVCVVVGTCVAAVGVGPASAAPRHRAGAHHAANPAALPPSPPASVTSVPPSSGSGAVNNGQSPAPNPTNDLENHGGPIMLTPTIYDVFWLPTGNHYEPTTGNAATDATNDTNYENLLDRFFGDVGGNNFYNLVTQYPGNNGTETNATTFGGSYTDTTAYDHNGTQTDPLLDSNVQSAATRAATHFGVTPDINHIFMVYTGINIFECQSNVNPLTTGQCNFFTATGPGSTNAYCAYHSSFNSNKSIYAFMGDDSNGAGCSNGVAPNGDTAADAEISSASHEFIEAVTDPLVNVSGSFGWFDDTSKNEIGDGCNRNDGPYNTSTPNADVFLGTPLHPYDIQQEWSNAVHGCAMDLNAAKTSVVPPTVGITKTGPATAATGETITYTIAVNNPSNTDASTLTTVTDTLPGGVTFVSSNPAPTTTTPPTWNLNTIAVHDTSTITMQAKVGGPAALNNCASVTFDDMLQIASHSAGPSCAATTVSKGDTTTVVTSTANPSVFGQPVTFTATVSPVAPATGTPTGNVIFSDNGVPSFTAALVGGVATWSTPPPTLSVGTHPITAQYTGDASYNGSTSATFNQVVNKAPTTTTITASPPSPATFGTNVTFTATVTVPAPGAGQPTGTVTFLVDGTSLLTVPLNAASPPQASFSISSLGAGTHTITGDYSGDGNFLASSGSIPYTITCGTTITGSHPGGLVVRGSVCILNATTGPVHVVRGASVDIENSTLASISANRGNVFRMCASTVHGGLIVKNATGFVLVGDSDDGCRPDTINSGVTVSGSHAGFEMAGGSVGGSLNVLNNVAGGPAPDDLLAVEVSGDTIGGGLSCSGNTLVSDDLVLDNAAGAKTGQCAGL